MAFFLCAAVVVGFMILFEESLRQFGGLFNMCYRVVCCKSDLDISNMSDDLYCEVSFDRLYEMYKQVKRERAKYKMLKSKGEFTEQ